MLHRKVHFPRVLLWHQGGTKDNGFGATVCRLTGVLPPSQTGLTLLLKNAYKLGKQARAVGRSPAHGDAEGQEGMAANGCAADGAAVADAHMAELLAELQAEARPE